MTSGGNNFNNFPENQLTKFSAVKTRRGWDTGSRHLTPGGRHDRHPLATLLLYTRCLYLTTIHRAFCQFAAHVSDVQSHAEGSAPFRLIPFPNPNRRLKTFLFCKFYELALAADFM